MKPHDLRSRAIAGLLAAVVGIGMLPPGTAHASRAAVCANAPADVFRDVAPGSTHADAIDCLAAYGITVGVGGGNYDPAGKVSRAQMASFLVRFTEVAADTDQPPVAFSPFSDVRADATHAANIRILAGLGVTQGTTPTTYAPADPVTRGQMATFVVRTLGVAGLDLGTGAADHFSDDDGSTHEAGINALAGSGVVRGVGAGRFEPNGHVTRAQMATFLANAAGLLAEQGVWRAPALTVEGARVELVTRAPDEDAAVDVRWDGPVTVVGTGTAYRVADEAGSDIVSLGTAVTSVDARTLRLTLDAPLDEGGIYWLQVAAGAVTDADGAPSVAQQIAFTFAAVDAGGTGGGTGGDVEAAPAIVSIATQPPDAIRVSFDAPVVCPTGAGALAAWAFSNTRTMQHDLQPDEVAQTSAPSTSCDLVFAAGIVDGDHGALTYTKPAATDQQVRTAAGTPLESATNVDVEDGIAPTFDFADAFLADTRVTLWFSEPVLCLSLHKPDFSVTVNDVDKSDMIESIDCEDPETTPSLVMATGAFAAYDWVRVTIVGDIYDQSQDNTVAPSSIAARAA